MDTYKTEFPREWLEQVADYFSALGFFQQYDLRQPGLISNLEWMANFHRLFREGPLNPTDEKNLSWKAEQLLLTLDTNRVWFRDSEADFQEGEYWYLRTLLDWSHISQNRFHPQRLSEIWLPRQISDCPDDGSDIGKELLKVSFSLGEKEIFIALKELHGWFDYELILAVNNVICNTGFQFASVQSICDQCVFVCCLNTSEIQKLKTERGWKFHEHLFHDSSRNSQKMTPILPFQIEANESELVIVGEYRQSGRQVKLRADAAAALQRLTTQARADGVVIVPVSGFRSVEYQKELYERAIAKHGSEEIAAHWVAYPGTSEHHTGLAIDVGDETKPETDIETSFEETAAFAWLQKNAAQFGFELSYPRGNTTGINYEPWHWRFIGTPEARQIIYK